MFRLSVVSSGGRLLLCDRLDCQPVQRSDSLHCAHLATSSSGHSRIQAGPGQQTFAETGAAAPRAYKCGSCLTAESNCPCTLRCDICRLSVRLRRRSTSHQSRFGSHGSVWELGRLFRQVSWRRRRLPRAPLAVMSPLKGPSKSHRSCDLMKLPRVQVDGNCCCCYSARRLVGRCYSAAVHQVSVWRRQRHSC